MEVVFISNHFSFLPGPLNLSINFEEDLISCVKDIPKQTI
jgi:hypothetical protein